MIRKNEIKTRQGQSPADVHPAQANRHRPAGRHFTLIELAAVCIIIAIIAGISISAFVKLGKGKNVENSAIIMGSMLKAVRAYAITNNCYAALVIPDTQSINTDYLFRSYRACVVGSYDSTNNGYPFSSWIKDEKWGFLPKGAAISSISAPDTVLNVPFNNLVGTTGTTPASCYGVVFTPTGDTVSQGKIITISEATYSGGGLVYTSKNSATGTNPNYATITVDQYTGRVSYGTN